MTDTFKMSIGEAHEFELACRRNGATHEDLKFLSGGKRLARALAILRGEALPATTLGNINPADILVSTPINGDSETLWVAPDLACLVNLAPCEDDNRLLQPLLTLPQAMNSSTIAELIGGFATLAARKATLGQLVREVNLARAGEIGLFKKGRGHLLYIEGFEGSLVAVTVYWNSSNRMWCVNCYRLDRDIEWYDDVEVYGN